MNASESTLHHIERAIRKAVEKLPCAQQEPILSDLYLQVKQESGELLIFDDDERELTRCVVEEWIDNKDEDFYEAIQPSLRTAIERQKGLLESVRLLRPFSLVLTDEEHEIITDLYLVDDDQMLLHRELMEGLSEDLDAFFRELMAKT